MPLLSSQQISDISTRILVAAGATEANGRIVGDHLADANMTGHDSHGFIRVPQYVEDIGPACASRQPSRRSWQRAADS